MLHTRTGQEENKGRKMDTIVENVAAEFCGSVAETIGRLNAAHEEVSPKIEEALERYVERVERDAVAGLNRPHWLLSRSIASKIKTYRFNVALGSAKTPFVVQKFWAIVGAKRETKDPRDPGVYGKYHEWGWLPGTYRLLPYRRFLRKAKDRNIGQLEKEVSEAYDEIRAIFKRGS